MARVDMDFEVDGEKQLSRFFEATGSDLKDFSDIFKAWGKDFRERQHSVFRSEGAFEGRQRWQELSPAYKDWKDIYYPGANILERTRRLWDSLVSEGDPDHVYSVSKDEFKIGTSVPYAIFHQRGQGVPQRKVIQLTEPQKTDWTQICRKEVWENAQKNANIYDIRKR